MKNTTMLSLTMMAAVCAVACGDTGTNPSPINRFVPGDRALDNDPCEHEFATGHECVRRGDICPDGGNRPSVMQCVLGTWRCVIDTTRTCQRPAMPACPEVQDTTCSLGFCPDGSPVPAQITCVSGRNICLPVAPGCPRIEPDAGVTPEDANDSGTDSTPTPPPGELRVEPLGVGIDLRTDGTDQELIGIRFYSTGAPVRLKMYRFSVIPSGPTNFSPPPEWSMERFFVAGTATGAGTRLNIAHDPASSDTPTRITVTIWYERAIQVDRDGVNAILYGRTTRTPQSGDRLGMSFTFAEGRYSYAGSTIGALTPVTYYTVPGGIPSNGPHLYYGMGTCDRPVPAAYMMPGNLTPGILLWSPEGPYYNELDCLSPDASRTWHNVVTPPPSMTGAPPSNGFAYDLRVR